MNAVAAIPGVAQRINPDEVIKEVFGALGYRTGERFFLPADQVQTPPDPMAQAEMLKQQNDAKRLEIEAIKVQQRQEESMAKLALERELGYADLALRENVSLSQLRAKLATDGANIKTKRQIAAVQEANKTNELAYKARTGKQGI